MSTRRYTDLPTDGGPNGGSFVRTSQGVKPNPADAPKPKGPTGPRAVPKPAPAPAPAADPAK